MSPGTRKVFLVGGLIAGAAVALQISIAVTEWRERAMSRALKVLGERADAAQPMIKDALARSGSPPASAPISGRVLPIERYVRASYGVAEHDWGARLAAELYKDLPGGLRATEDDEGSTIAWLEWEGRRYFAGSYGIVATDSSCVVSVIDRAARAVVARTTVAVPPPPGSVTFQEAYRHNALLRAKVVEYLGSLQKR